MSSRQNAKLGGFSVCEPSQPNRWLGKTSGISRARPAAWPERGGWPLDWFIALVLMPCKIRSLGGGLGKADSPPHPQTASSLNKVQFKVSVSGFYLSSTGNTGLNSDLIPRTHYSFLLIHSLLFIPQKSCLVAHTCNSRDWGKRITRSLGPP